MTFETIQVSNLLKSRDPLKVAIKDNVQAVEKSIAIRVELSRSQLHLMQNLSYEWVKG